MRIFFIISFVILGCSAGTAQFYFNNMYNNVNVNAELSAHISILEDGSYLTPSVSIDEDSCRYSWRVIGQEGVELILWELLDSNYLFYPGQFDSFFQSLDGNYLQAHILPKAGVMKFSTNGQLLWQMSIDSIVGATNALLEMSDSDIFFLGAYVSSPHINFIRTNEVGEIEQQVYATPIDSAVATYLEHSKELPDKQILLGGYSYFPRTEFSLDGDAVMSRIDSLGNILWTKIWDDDLWDQMATFCDGDNDSTVVIPIKKVTWHEDNDYHDPYTALVGTALVNVNTGDTSQVIFQDLELINVRVNEIIRTPDGGYCLMGWNIVNAYGHTFCMKLDANRQLEWLKQYTPQPLEVANYSLESYDIEVTSDSGFVVVGEATEWAFEDSKQMPWIFKTDQCGELVWNNCGADNTHEFNDSNIQRFKIAPNPVSDVVSISSEQPIQSIIVRDITGKIVLVAAQLSGLQTQVNVSTLAKGLYLVEVDFGGGVIGAQKLVVE